MPSGPIAFSAQVALNHSGGIPNNMTESERVSEWESAHVRCAKTTSYTFCEAQYIGQDSDVVSGRMAGFYYSHFVYIWATTAHVIQKRKTTQQVSPEISRRILSVPSHAGDVFINGTYIPLMPSLAVQWSKWYERFSTLHFLSR